MILALSGCATTSEHSTPQLGQKPPYCSIFDDTNTAELTQMVFGEYAKFIQGDVEVTYCSEVISESYGYLIYSTTLRDRTMKKPYFRIDKLMRLAVDENNIWQVESDDTIFFYVNKSLLSPHLHHLVGETDRNSAQEL